MKTICKFILVAMVTAGCSTSSPVPCVIDCQDLPGFSEELGKTRILLHGGKSLSIERVWHKDVGFESEILEGETNRPDFLLTLITAPDREPLALEYCVPSRPDPSLAPTGFMHRTSSIIVLSPRYFGETDPRFRSADIRIDGEGCADLRRAWCDWMKECTALQLKTVDIDRLNEEIREWSDHNINLHPILSRARAQLRKGEVSVGPYE